MTCATAGLRCDAPLRDIARRGCALLGGWCAMEQRDPYGPLRCECACDPPPCRCRVERGLCALNAKHRGEAGVAAEFTRFDDGGVALRMRCPSGVVHGDAHAEALATGLWDVRQTARTLAALRASPAPESAHVLAWCERVWREQGMAAREAPNEGTTT